MTWLRARNSRSNLCQSASGPGLWSLEQVLQVGSRCCPGNSRCCCDCMPGSPSHGVALPFLAQPDLRATCQQYCMALAVPQLSVLHK